MHTSDPNIRDGKWSLIFGSGVFALILVLLTLFSAQGAPVASFNVNSYQDVVDFNPGDGVCETQDSNGICTLRAAIMETNALGGSNSIQIPAGTYTLTIAGVDEDQSATGDLDIKSDLTINGAGATSTFINGNHIDRIFHIVGTYPSPLYTVELDGITIKNGNANYGAAIKSDFCSLTLTGVIIENNVSTSNTGSIQSIGAVAQLLLSNSIIQNNSGGGIYVNTSKVNIEDSTIQGNRGGNKGAGIANHGGVITVTQSIIYNNATNDTSSSQGGGLYSNSTLTLIQSQVYSNSVYSGDGGGIYSAWNVSLDRSKVYSNTANHGGGIFNAGGTVIANTSNIYGNTSAVGGGIYSNDPSSGSRNLTLINSTINDNSASGANPNGLGGGILSGTSMTVTNSTISGNNARQGGGIWLALGSGITLTLNNATISSNDATQNGGGYYDAYPADGVKIIANTILAGNTSGVSAPDCGGALTSAGYNLIGNNSGCTFTTASGDQVGTIGSPIDSLLGPLANNGGSTLTHVPLPGSPAIDSGNPTTPGSSADACLEIDQRGFKRPVGGQCDIGAVERGLQIYLPVVLR